LLIGAVVVRRLRLPTDLPEAARYEPPPPVLVQHATRDEARAIAATRCELAALLATVHTAVHDALHCQELRHASAHLSADATHGAAATAIAAAAEDAVQAAETADRHAQRLHVAPNDSDARDAIPALVARAAEARVRADAAAKTIPDSGNRRLWLMLGALAVLVAWMVAMKLMLAK
jgi:hypothetical protein